MNQEYLTIDEEQKQIGNNLDNRDSIRSEQNQSISIDSQNENEHHQIHISTQNREQQQDRMHIVENQGVENSTDQNNDLISDNRQLQQLNNQREQINRAQHEILNIFNQENNRQIQRVKCFDIWFRLYILSNLMAFFLFYNEKFSDEYFFLFIAISSLAILAQKCGIFVEQNHYNFNGNSAEDHLQRHNRHRTSRNRQQLQDLVRHRRQLIQLRAQRNQRRTRRISDITSQLDYLIPQRMDIIQIGRGNNNNIETLNTRINRPQLQVSFGPQNVLQPRSLNHLQQTLENLRNRQNQGAQSQHLGEITILLNQMLAGSSILQIIENIQNQQQNNGLTQEQIDKISTQSLSQEIANKLQACSICLLDFEIKDQVRMLPCQHGFHINCVDVWLKQQNMCPNCRHKAVEVTQ
ncbi:hypothetical protein PPERSA_01060 [Pseudocohnilembus persalinus]|uniref:RING-type domain-containing protein n=1 Tax=Pseudocohnilembus persalinus TaxID=266149 RepID=A0A0V0QUU0_PSEPJ|nr:hypothetical protein PPERSA_01060 [Pseudocohnilembus persalinus]|eukprot:KRX05982.1 hypothetical protein PPERSA_01060 [Pseudocohnilembus persalinus]